MNIYMIVNLVFYVLFVVFVIVSLVYDIKLLDSYGDISCNIVKFPNNILNGVSQGSVFFIGINPLLSLLGKLKTDIANIGTLESNF